jgi:hypothetical protein
MVVGALGAEVWAGTELVVPGGTVVDDPGGTVVDEPGGTVVDEPGGTVVDEPGALVVVESAMVVAVVGPAGAVVGVGFLVRGRAVVVVVCPGLVPGLVVDVVGNRVVEVGTAEVVVGLEDAGALGTASASLDAAEVPLPSTAATVK